MGSEMAEPARTSYCPEIEQQVLGECLLNDAAMDGAASRLRADHFQEPVHARLWECMQARRLAGEGVSPSLLAPLFREDAGMADLGGPGYLAKLAGAAVSSINLPHAVAAMIEAHHRFEIKRMAEEAAQAAMDMTRKPREAAEALESGLLTLSADDAKLDRTAYASATEWLLPHLTARQNGDSMLGVCSGLTALDRLTGGLMPGDLAVLAGRPGMGKSVVGLFYAWAAARSGGTVLFASLEMSEPQVNSRLLSLDAWAESGAWVQYMRILRGEMNDIEARRVFDASQRMKDIPLRLTAPDVRSVGAIAAAARRAQRIGQAAGRPLDLVVIDYLGFVKPPRERQSKVNEIGDITGALKALARQINAPILLLSQLNRGVEQRGRDDRRPLLSDLRDSGDIEQDADTVMLLYRPEYYLRREEPETHSDKWEEWRAAMDKAERTLEIDVAKNRMGETGRATVWCDVGICALADMNGGPQR